MEFIQCLVKYPIVFISREVECFASINGPGGEYLDDDLIRYNLANQSWLLTKCRQEIL